MGVFCVGVTLSPALAQNSFPEFTLTDKQQSLSAGNGFEINIDESLKNIKNPLLRDRFQLQHQVILLKHLLQQQKEVKNIAENYRKSGISFSQKAPTESICAQLPTNILCTLTYPEKSNSQDVIAEAYEKAMTAQKQEVLKIFQEIYKDYLSTISQNSYSNTPTASNALTKILGPADFLAWSDISCRGSECTALIENKNDDTGYRQRVKIDDIITKDSHIYTVANINIGGVTLKAEQASYQIRPKEKTRGLSLFAEAPAAIPNDIPSPNNPIDFLNPDAVGDAVNNRFSQFTNKIPLAMPEAPSAQNTAAIPEQGIQDTGSAPTLGPTGLF